MEWRQVAFEWAELTCLYFYVAHYVMCFFVFFSSVKTVICLSVNGTFHMCYRNVSVALLLWINVTFSY